MSGSLWFGVQKRKWKEKDRLNFFVSVLRAKEKRKKVSPSLCLLTFEKLEREENKEEKDSESDPRLRNDTESSHIAKDMKNGDGKK